MIRIIDKKTNNIVAFNYVKNNLYELINYNFDKAFISINQTITIIIKILFERKHFILITFELMY